MGLNAQHCHVKRRFKLEVFLFLFCLIVLELEPSAAIIMRAGNHNAFSAYSRDEIQRMIDYMTQNLDGDVAPSEYVYPGVINIIGWLFPDGKIVIIRLAVWNQVSCNLGKGGEVQYEPLPVEGLDLQEYLYDIIYPNIERLMRNNMGFGIVVHEGVSVDYSVYTLPQMNQPSDNDPASHRHEDLFELAPGPAGLGMFSNRSVESNANNSSSKISSNFTPRASQNASGNLPASSRSSLTNSNGTFARALPPNFHRNFPTTPEGDCDLPSLMMATAAGPYYDDENTHGTQVLNPTDKIWSPSTRFYLVMQLDCNLVLYDRIAETSLWSSATNDQGSVCYAAVSVYGEILVYDTDENNLLWRSRTWCSGNDGFCWTSTMVQVQDDGNVVLYIVDTDVLIPIWASNTVVCEGGCF